MFLDYNLWRKRANYLGTVGFFSCIIGRRFVCLFASTSTSPWFWFWFLGGRENWREQKVLKCNLYWFSQFSVLIKVWHHFSCVDCHQFSFLTTNENETCCLPMMNARKIRRSRIVKWTMSWHYVSTKTATEYLQSEIVLQMSFHKNNTLLFVGKLFLMILYSWKTMEWKCDETLSFRLRMTILRCSWTPPAEAIVFWNNNVVIWSEVGFISLWASKINSKKYSKKYSKKCSKSNCSKKYS